MYGLKLYSHQLIIEKNKIWCTQTMEYYQAIKNETMTFAKSWVELELIALSKISQTKEDKWHMSYSC